MTTKLESNEADSTSDRRSATVFSAAKLSIRSTHMVYTFAKNSCNNKCFCMKMLTEFFVHPNISEYNSAARYTICENGRKKKRNVE